MIHVGIDLHSRNMTLAAVNDNGDLVLERKIVNSPLLLEQFFADLPRPVQAVVECTSFWFWLADWCSGHDIPLYLAHAKMLKAISYAKVKTDAVDARTLADLLRVDLIPKAHQPPLDQRELRERTRARVRMIDNRRHVQSRLWHLAAKYNVIIDEVGWRYLDRVEGLLLGRLPAAVHLESRLLLGQIRQIQQDIVTMEQDITTQVHLHPRVALLQDLPGFGLVCSWTVMAEIGDITRFPSAREFTSYCRLVPGSKDSGGKQRHRRGNKDGNRYPAHRLQSGSCDSHHTLRSGSPILQQNQTTKW
jgi:transposase